MDLTGGGGTGPPDFRPGTAQCATLIAPPDLKLIAGVKVSGAVLK
jgi:hypothetical protein